MKPRITMNRTCLWAGLLALALLQGCAVGPNPRDPFEPFNRSVTRFNDGLDEAIVKPVAQAYQNTVPSPVRTGVNNFFGNLSDVWSFVNNVLQARPQEAVDSFMRVSVNTLIGLGGVLDWATPMGIERHSEDFGKTLGRWGVATGPLAAQSGKQPPALTWCCRCWAPRRCGMRPPVWSTPKAIWSCRSTMCLSAIRCMCCAR